MAFSVSVPPAAPEDFDQTVELILQRERPTLALTGSIHAAELAVAAAKEIIKSWDVAKGQYRRFGATIEGHSNPSGEAPAGFPNDTISVTVYRSDDQSLSFDRAVREAVAAELAKRDANAAFASAASETVESGPDYSSQDLPPVAL